MGSDRLALDLAVTIRHDGEGGVADDLTTLDGLTAWMREHAEALPADLAGFTADAAALAAVRDLRTAVRALFARAVAPGAPSKADAGRLPAPSEALDHLNAAAAAVPVVPRLDWAAGRAPVAHEDSLPAAPPAVLTAALARAAVAFLAGPDRDRLRACPAPRCVRYFVKEHARQEWCGPSCGNRARVARHHQRRRTTAAGGEAE